MVLKKADGKPTRVFGLLSGQPGVGKTTQLTTFPISETLGVSIEDGFLSIEGSGYAYEEISSYDEFIDLLENVQKRYPWCKYLFIDSITEIYNLLQRELKHKYTAKQNFAKHEDMLDMLIHPVRLARQLPISVFFTCHTKEEKDGMSITEQLAFDGKTPALILKQFDLAIHFTYEDDTRVFITDPLKSKIAKARVSPWLGQTVESYEEPNLYKLTQKLLGKK